MEAVECSECGTRYDSDNNAFCPRCGSTSKGGPVAGALQAARRSDPRRRRVQAAGIILMVMGSVAFAQFLYAAIVVPDLDPSIYEQLQGTPLADASAGGAVHLHYLENGTPLAGLRVRIDAMAGNQSLELTTNDAGWANTTKVPSAFITITVQNSTTGANFTAPFVRHAYAPFGQTLVVQDDLAKRTGTETPWSAPSLATEVRIIAGFLAGFAVLVAAAGLLAFKLRAFGLALAGAILAVVPALLLALVLPNLLSMLNLVAVVFALVFIAKGRSQFARA